MASELQPFQSLKEMVNDLIEVNVDLLDEGDSVKIGKQADRVSKIRNLVSQAIVNGQALLSDK